MSKKQGKTTKKRLAKDIKILRKRKKDKKIKRQNKETITR